MSLASSVLAALALVGLLAVLFIVVMGVALARVLKLPGDNPRAVLARRRGGGPRKPRTVAFVGASIIHGRVSASLPERVLALLGPAAHDVDVVNAGLNGDLAYNALRRADEVLACEPTHVIVLVGSNDVMGTLSARDARRYRIGKRLPRAPDLAFYRSSLEELLVKLADSGARVAVCTLPMLGEDAGSSLNERVRAYNDVVRDVVRQLTGRHRIEILDVNGALWDELRRRGGGPAEAMPDATPEPMPEPMLGARMLLPMLARGATGARFETIGKRFGFRLLADGVHLTEPAADIVAGLMADFVRAPAAR